MPAIEVVDRSAVISPCESYRYHLTRAWSMGEGEVVFIMLNPSTADASLDDPTIRRCVGFGAAWGFRSLVVVNLFAWRATQPSELGRVHDPVGPLADAYLLAAAGHAQKIVCAWGNDGHLQGRGEAVCRLLKEAGHPLFHLGLTQSQAPRHPLYLKKTLQPELWVF